MSQRVLIEQALERARAKHPEWPTDIFQQLAIIGEEFGEAQQAAIEWHFRGEPLEKVQEEIRQTAAMCLRFLERG